MDEREVNVQRGGIRDGGCDHDEFVILSCQTMKRSEGNMADTSFVSVSL